MRTVAGGRLSVFVLVSLCLSTLFLTGCPQPEPEVQRPPVTVVDAEAVMAWVAGQLPPAKCSDAGLKARITNDRALGQAADSDRSACEKEQRTRSLAKVRRWCFWGGLACGVLAVVAAALTLKWPGKWRLTLAVAGLLATLSGLAFAVDYLLAHPWKFALAVALLIVVGVVLRACGKWAELRAWARTAAAGIQPEKVAEEWAEELKHARDQSVETFAATAAKLRGK